MLVKVYALCAILCSSGLLAVPSPVIDTLASPLDLTERRLGPGGLPGGAKHYAASPKPRQATRNQIIARAKTSPRKRAESARPAVCSATFDATATQVALFEDSNWSFPEVSTMPNGPFTTETCAARCVDMGTASCVVSAVADGDCYYSPGTTQLYGGAFRVTLPGLTCEQARSMYPPAQATNVAGSCSMLYCK